jgi:hypothetical protein
MRITMTLLVYMMIMNTCQDRVVAVASQVMGGSLLLLLAVFHLRTMMA